MSRKFITCLLLCLLVVACRSDGEDGRLADIELEDLADGDQLKLIITPAGRLPEDRLPEDRLPEDRLPEDRLPEDRLPEDRLPEDRLPEDRLPADELPDKRTTGDGKIEVVLNKDKQFDQEFPILVDGEEDKSIRKRDVSFYTGEDGHLSLKVERAVGGRHPGRRSAEGEFTHAGKRYTIRRATLNEYRRSHSRRGMSANYHMLHTKRGNTSKERSNSKRQEEDREGPYYIELAIFTDVSIFLDMGRRLKTNDKNKIIKNIHHRMSHIIHGVDLAYRRMKTVDMSVWIKALYVSTEYKTSEPVSIVALDDASRPLWNTDNARQKCKADANKVRENINKWLKQQKFKADHAMAFTMYDLWDMADSVDVVGQADFANMCESWRGSCVEWGSFHIWATVAHELAHNLNVDHDGDDTSAECYNDDYYLMTTESVHHDRQTIDNGFRFSPCTENTILETIWTNEEAGTNCLANKVNKHYGGLGRHFGVLAGVEYDLTKQCQIIFGDTSKPCVNANDFENICVLLYCSNPGSGGCETPGDFRAAMGTPCGNKKWCNEGKCIYNKKAKRYNVRRALQSMLLIE